MATAALAQWAAGLQHATLPEGVKMAARRSLYNWIGCTIHGQAHPAVHKAFDALEPFFGAPTSHLIGTNIKVDAPHAALLNGIASHVHDYDDTHLQTIIHPAGPVASATLAYAEFKGETTGPELMTAIVAGIEAECKLGLAVWPTHYDVGWHITSTTGAIGAAVAVGRLMALGKVELAHAIGLAAVQVIGLREMFGSDTKSFHPGRAAQAGLHAAILASRGYTSSAQALEAKRGWANVVVAGGVPRLDHFVGELGQVWEIEKNTFKPFPCGIVKHPAIDGAVQLHERLRVRGDKNAVLERLRVTVRVHPLVIELTSKRAPKDGLEAKFSVFHGVAVGVLFGKAGPAQYMDEVVRDPQVVSLRDRVKVEAVQDLRSDEASLTALDSDGTSLVDIHVEHSVGSLDIPMTDVQLKDKFEDQVSLTLDEGNTKRAAWLAWSMENAEDISEIISRMH